MYLIFIFEGLQQIILKKFFIAQHLFQTFR